MRKRRNSATRFIPVCLTIVISLLAIIQIVMKGTLDSNIATMFSTALLSSLAIFDRFKNSKNDLPEPQVDILNSNPKDGNGN